ncbi:MAG TPA: PD-(D/E)XK nuclease family protein [Candidatus Acidoferrales bacterium]|nr:PD-(D/E)XK nuclease family protein [Candidatus Acidoferrales bacterium]
MQAFLGPFHPELEDALVAEIAGRKKRDPISPLLIVVPSDSLRRRLKVLLARERALSLLNLRVLTFYQLSLELYQERHGWRPEFLADDLCLEEVLREILRREGPAARPFSALEEKIGGCAALWQTFRDLKDGTVDPAQALQAAREGYFGEDGEKVAALASLYRDFLSRCALARMRDYSDLDAWAAAEAPSSAFLRGFARIFYYGFYDLTQAQLDVFRAVARHFPTTLFFPVVVNHPAWAFAQNFYERYVHGFVDEGSTDLLAGARGKNPGGRRAPLSLFVDSRNGRPAGGRDLRCAVISCADARAELAVTAKEILRLAAEENIAFSEIGVVARTLDPYQPAIKEIFEEHSIPIRTSAAEPLSRFPFVKAVALLLRLAARDYPRPQVIDLVASPYFNLDLFSSGGVLPRPDLWDVLTRRLGVTKGLEEWRRLESFLQRDLAVTGDFAEEEGARAVSIPAAQIRVLWEVFSSLYRDLGSLPPEDSWSGYVRSWKRLAQKHLRMPALASAREHEAHAKLFQTIDRLGALDAVAPRTSLERFSATAERWLDLTSLPLSDPNADGVSVLDAMSARGLKFRALFLIGLNEGAFPRTIREDAFLRDRARRVFAQVLGYKIGEKLAAFDEEKLLFTLLVEGAQERLYGLYRRADESGTPVGRSWYLDELPAVADGPPSELTIPRALEQKRAVEPFCRSEYLTPRELAIDLNLRGEDPLPAYENIVPGSALFRRAQRAVEELEAGASRLGSRDGIVPHLAAYWRLLRERGIAPTALEAYARCPFQFFATQILRLERLEEPEAEAALAPSEAGKIVHAVLNRFYAELTRRDFFSSSGSRVDPKPLLERIAAETFADYERENPVGYAVAWEIFRENLMALLAHFVERDLASLRREGARPIALEKECSARLDPQWPPPLGGLPIQGKLDRIDFVAANRYRVIDYKYKTGAAPAPADSDLLVAAARGQRLQPPIYVLLARAFLAAAAENRPAPEIEAWFYFLAPSWREGPFAAAPFPAGAWEGESGKQIRQTLALLLAGISAGLFFIQPGAYCRYCAVSEICRKDHLPTRWRAEADPRTKPHRELARKKGSAEPADEDEAFPPS